MNEQEETKSLKKKVPKKKEKKKKEKEIRNDTLSPDARDLI
jgi:hypothetical protein